VLTAEGPRGRADSSPYCAAAATSWSSGEQVRTVHSHILALKSYRDRFDVVTCGPEDARVFRGAGEKSLLLVRRDGYLAARASPDELQTVLGYLQELTRSKIGTRTESVPDQRAADGLGAGVSS
jgi:hypothetical protein